ncbi:MAG: sigma-70 family RNA polymerase sigma factor [Planctomycetaceae bacterium]|nr:sigma-70 family RNA polymerase sigma factor [Planctomycetaceae bacterium]
MHDDPESEQLLHRARAGDQAAIDVLFSRHRRALRRMVDLRLNRKLRGRIDPSDVVQDALVEASRRWSGYVLAPQLPVYLWLRTFTQQKLLEAHRFHLGTAKRDARLEVELGQGDLSVSSDSLAAIAIEDATSVSQVVAGQEQIQALEALIETLSPLDREILALRHFEQLGNAAAARLLDIDENTASKRFLRALQRLRQKMRELGLDDD